MEAIAGEIAEMCVTMKDLMDVKLMISITPSVQLGPCSRQLGPEEWNGLLEA